MIPPRPYLDTITEKAGNTLTRVTEQLRDIYLSEPPFFQTLLRNNVIMCVSGFSYVFPPYVLSHLYLLSVLNVLLFLFCIL